jgi:hypothetical protein
MIKENLKIDADEMKAVWMPPEVHLALKKTADKEGVKIHNLVAILINNYLIHQNEKKIS